MIWLALLLTQSAAGGGDVAAGSKIFAKSCAVGYCHGSAGAAGRAPRIQGRALARDYLLKATRDGIPNTAMPGWGTRLRDEEIEAVVAYMMSLGTGGAPVPSGGSAALAATEPAPKFTAGPPEAQRGRELFFDAVRGTRCGTCHALEGWGAAVGPNLAAVPPGSADRMRTVETSHVVTARLKSGEQFPALAVEQKDDWVKVYDLTVPPPVLRTLPSSQVSLSPGSDWRHASSIRSYTDQDLGFIAAYLRWLSSR